MDLLEVNNIQFIDGTVQADLIVPSKTDMGTMTGVKIMVEPTTTTAVIAALANMAKSYLEGKKLESLFDNLGAQFEQIIRQAVEELKNFISDELDNVTIKDVQAYLDSARSHLLSYEKAPTEAKYRLERADIASTDAIYLMQRMGLKGIFIYTNAVSIKLVTHIARYKAFGDKGELDIANDFLNIGIPHVQELANLAVEVWEKRIAGVTQIETWKERKHCSRCNIDCESEITRSHFYDNGREVRDPNLVETRNSILNNYQDMKQQTIEHVLIPVSIAVGCWKELLNGEKQLLRRIDC